MVVDNDIENIGYRQSEVRKQMGLTQQEMAERLGIPMRTLSDNERGISTAGGKVLATYAGLGISVDWLLTGEGKPFREAGDVKGKDLVDHHTETRIAIPLFQQTEIRETYMVDRTERLRRAAISLAPEIVERMIPVRDLGLPDQCRLIAVDIHDEASGQNRVVFVDTSITECKEDGQYLIERNGTLQVRRIQPLGKDQLILFRSDSRSVETMISLKNLKVLGHVLASF